MVIFIVGPTGVGKTAMSIKLAKVLNGEIINADSTQIFKEMNIGTAKVTLEEQKEVKHHLIDIKTLNDEYTLYDYQRNARKIIDDLLKENKIPIIVGGSGLYVSALLYNYNLKQEKDKKINVNIEKMIEELKEKAIEIDSNNIQRVERYYKKYILNEEEKENNTELYYNNSIVIGLTTNRDALYKRINKRVEEMLDNDLLLEVETLYKKYPNSKQLKSTIGYKEIIGYLDENISYDKCIELIKQHSRNYAKRQYTWFNNKMNVKWINVNFDNFELTINEAISKIKSD